jgi:hypothetical protein
MQQQNIPTSRVTRAVMHALKIQNRKIRRKFSKADWPKETSARDSRALFFHQSTESNRFLSVVHYAESNPQCCSHCKVSLYSVAEIILSSYTATGPHSYTATWLHGYTATRLHGYTVTWLHAYTTTRLHGYTVTWLHGFTATRLQGRTDEFHSVVPTCTANFAQYFTHSDLTLVPTPLSPAPR